MPRVHHGSGVTAVVLAAIVGGCAPTQPGSAIAATPSTPAGSSLPAEPTGGAFDVAGLALSGLDAASAAPFVSRAVSDAEVLSTLGNARWRAVEVDSGDAKSGVTVVLYDYTNSRALRVVFDRTSGEIVGRTMTLDQPSFGRAELAEAEALALASDALAAEAGGARYTVQTATAADATSFDGHRVVAVILAASDRADLIVAYADLSSGSIVRVERHPNP
jgi:hypothetical protein